MCIRDSINPVNNSGTNDSTNAGKRISAMRKQCVDKRTGKIARSRMYDHPLRLIHHQEITVLIDCLLYTSRCV